MMKTVKEFPTMERFRAHWPVTNLIQFILKTSAAKAKTREAKERGETPLATSNTKLGTRKRSNRKAAQNHEVSQTYSILRV
jgi:hypothetical protein